MMPDIMIIFVLIIGAFILGASLGIRFISEPSESEMVRRIIEIRTQRKIKKMTEENFEDEINTTAARAALTSMEDER